MTLENFMGMVDRNQWHEYESENRENPKSDSDTVSMVRVLICQEIYESVFTYHVAYFDTWSGLWKNHFGERMPNNFIVAWKYIEPYEREN